MIHLDAMGIYGDDIMTVYNKHAKEDLSKLSVLDLYDEITEYRCGYETLGVLFAQCQQQRNICH